MTLKVIVLLGVLVVAILAKLPVFLSLALSVCSYALCFPDSMYLEVLGQGLVTGLNNYSYAGVLFFFLSGEIMSKGGISNRIIRFFRACIGHIRGGLSHVNVLRMHWSYKRGIEPCERSRLSCLCRCVRKCSC